MIPPSVDAARRVWRGAAWSDGSRVLAEETAIAITYNRVTHAVMMATPTDLLDFAIGFSLSEDIVPAEDAILEFEVLEAEGGVELRMWIAPQHMEALEKRKRRLAGATGCGMCGLESLGEALRPVPAVSGSRTYSATQIQQACADLRPAQTLSEATRAVHGAGFWREGEGLLAVREDVGRHNALDKLAGFMAREGQAAENGLLLLTSRISIELVQKAARMSAPILAAVSAPTALAVRAAETCGMTLVGIARDDGFEVFTHGWRVT